MKKLIKEIPVLGGIAKRIHESFLARSSRSNEPFPGSAEYWEQRYSTGGNSGPGSYAALAEFKADVLNGFVNTHGVETVIEFGCGDGNQLALAEYPAYLGLDVSSTAISRCRERFAADPRKSFQSTTEYRGEKAMLALSLDVIYHLVEDDVFDEYMRTLFAASERYVIIYASDSDDTRDTAAHVRHRKFTAWVREQMPTWRLVEHVPNRYPYRGDTQTGSFAEFFIYEKG